MDDRLLVRSRSFRSTLFVNGRSPTLNLPRAHFSLLRQTVVASSRRVGRLGWPSIATTARAVTDPPLPRPGSALPRLHANAAHIASEQSRNTTPSATADLDRPVARPPLSRTPRAAAAAVTCLSVPTHNNMPVALLSRSTHASRRSRKSTQPLTFDSFCRRQTAARLSPCRTSLCLM